MTLEAKIYPKSDHYDGETFFNPTENDEKGLLSVLKWKLTSSKVTWPKSVANKNYAFIPLTEDKKSVVTFINHATFLIQLPGLNVLTDPVFSERVSPFTFAGPKRVRRPGIEFENLPAIDVVLISHCHYDHLDIESLKRLDAKFHPIFMVPLGNESFLKENGLEHVQEMDWWQVLKVKDVAITFTQAQHWANRWPWDRNKTLWGGFMLDQEKNRIFFAGDTGYSTHFKAIQNRLGSPDLALLPIGAYAPRWFMKVHHMNPEEAVQASLDLGAKASIGMHFGTFQLTDEGIEEPVKDLELAKKKAAIPDEKFKTLDSGETAVFN